MRFKDTVLINQVDIEERAPLIHHRLDQGLDLGNTLSSLTDDRIQLKLDG